MVNTGSSFSDPESLTPFLCVCVCVCVRPSVCQIVTRDKDT